MGRLIKIICIAVLAVLIVCLAALYFLPSILKDTLADKLSQTLHRPVAVREISVNPWELSATVRGLAIRDTAGEAPFVAFDELYINLEVLSSLAQRAVVLKEIHLSRPEIHVKRHADGSFNFSDLIVREETKPQAKKEKPLYFSFHNIKIIDGNILFNDEPAQMNHAVGGMNLSLPLISNLQKYTDVFIEPQLSAKVNGSLLHMTGRAKPFHPSRETHIALDLADLDVPFYLPYIPLKLNGKLVSALVSAKLKTDFSMREEKPDHLLLTGSVDLKDVALDDSGKSNVLRVPAARIDLNAVMPLEQDIHLSRVAVEKPVIAVKRGKDGKINLLDLLPPPSDEKKSELIMRIDELAVHESRVDFHDAVPPVPVGIRITPLDLRMMNLSTEKGAAGKCDLSVELADKKGEIAVKGTVVLDPLQADLAIDVKKIVIGTFQAYFNDKVKVNVAGGTLSSKGNLSLTLDRKGAPRAAFKGIFSIADFAAVDKARADPFVNWKQLYFDGINAGYNPFFIDMKGISLTDYFARIIVWPDGKLNLQDIFVEEGQKAEKEAAPEVKKAETAKETGVPLNVKVGKVTLQGGTIHFSDRFIKPNYSARMLNMSGSIAGLSSDASSKAQVDLRGNLGSGSPIEITGKINPLVEDLFADMKFSFKNIELSPMTPYAAKFLGHPILKGKLTYNAEYLIDGRKLDAQNKVFIDQLTFGDRLESPDALKAPVKLAVTLLADRNGQINLDIPVSGSLDDPKFRVWPIVWQVIKNLIMKAATAPFALLASLTGGGEEMGYIEFAYGSADITAADMKKINALVKVMAEKPDLEMDIEGHAAGEKDREGLKASDLRRKIRAQKINDMVKQGEQVGSPDRVDVQAPEYEKYLTLAYEAAPFPKPRTDAGALKRLSIEEMEKLMLTHAEVTDNDVMRLAARRAERIREIILKSGAVMPDRVFVVQSEGTSPATKEKLKESRVDIRLK